MKYFLLSIVTMLGISQAKADIGAPLWACSLEAEASGFSVSLILSFTDIKGEGVVRCARPGEPELYMPVAIKVSGVGVGIGISEIKDIEVYSMNVGVTEPEQMLGDFKAGLGGDVTFIKGGAGVQVGVAGQNGIAFDLALVGKKANGLQVKAEGFVLSVDPI